jgi:hypothetical protein
VNVFSHKEFVSKVNGKVVNAIPPKAIEYNGMTHFKKDMLNKIKTYREVKGKLPLTIAFDTVTNLYKMVNDYVCTTTKNNFGSHSADTAKEMDSFLSWVEKVLVSKGINVIFLAHALTNKETGVLQIATSGSKTFESTGGFYGSVNFCSYLYVKDGMRLIAHRDLEYVSVCRSMLTDIEDFESIDDFSIQDMIDKVNAFEAKAEENEI